MKKLFGIFSLSVLLFSTFAPCFTYANEVEDLAKEILTEELENSLNQVTSTTSENNTEENNTEENNNENTDNNSLLTNEIINNNGNNTIETMNVKTAKLLEGVDFNLKIKKLANSSITQYTKPDTLITTIERGTATDSVKTENNKISSSDSEYPVYAWYDNGTIYYDTEADTIYFNENSSQMFNGFKNLENINFHDFDLSHVTDAYMMIYGNTKLEELDMSNMDLGKLTSYLDMFESNSGLKKVNFSHSILSGITSMYSMFNSSDNIEEYDFSYADLRNLTQTDFDYLDNLKIVKFNNANLSSMTSMYRMFDGCSSLESADFSNAILDNVTTMKQMFKGCRELNDVKFNGTELPALTSTEGMFNRCTELENIDFDNFDTSNVTNMKGMFIGCKKLNPDFSKIKSENATDMSEMFKGCESITGVDLSEIKTNNAKNISSMFYEAFGLENVNFSGSHLENVENMSSMFYKCNGLTGVTIENLNLGKVTTLNSMFSSCYNLKTIKIKNIILDEATDLNNMLSYTVNLKNIDFEGTKLNSPATMSYMFYDTGITGFNLSTLDTRNVTSMEYMFGNNTQLKEINIKDADLSNLKNMNYMFQGCTSLTGIDFSNMNLNKVENMNNMFSRDTALKKVDFSNVNLSGLTSLSYSFNTDNYIEEIDFSNANLSNVTTTNSMFSNAINLKNVNFSGTDLSSLEDAGYMFSDCPKLKNVNFRNNKASNIESINNMFTRCTGLITIDLSELNLTNVKYMNNLFYGSNSLSKVEFGDQQIKNVINMSRAFYGCSRLKEIDLSNFDTSKVTNMSHLFEGDRSIRRIYTSDKFNTGNVENSESMFGTNDDLVGGNRTKFTRDHTDISYARIDTESTSGYFTDIIDKEYTIYYDIDTRDIIGWLNNEGTYTPRGGTEFKRAAKPGYELEYWYESGHNEPFVITESTRGDKVVYPKWKALEEKVEEASSENVVYGDETTVAIGDYRYETIDRFDEINLVSKEVESNEVKIEDEKTKVQESEIQVASGKTAEYQGGLEVYIEKTENKGTENQETKRLTGTAMFSFPIAIKIPIYSDAEAVKVKVKHEGEEFSYRGLTLNPTEDCRQGETENNRYNGELITVTNKNNQKYALIYTCSASTFVAFTENTKSAAPSPAAGGGRTITSTNQEPKVTEQEHNSADIEKIEVEKITTGTTQVTDTQSVEKQINKIQGRSLSRGEVAVMTNILLDVYPQLIEGRTELDDITNACSNYTDEQNFTKDEKKAITRLCKLSIMGIHADNNKPLDEFLVNSKSTNDEFSKVINRSIETYNEKDLSTIKDALKKLEGDEENVVFGTVYDVFMSIKNIFN